MIRTWDTSNETLNQYIQSEQKMFFLDAASSLTLKSIEINQQRAKHETHAANGQEKTNWEADIK